MPRYLILAQAEVPANALKAFRRLLNPEPSGPEASPEAIVVDPRTWGERELLANLRGLVQRLEGLAAPPVGAPVDRSVVVLVDSVRPTSMNPLAEDLGWDGLLALLILSFPELGWVFGVCLESGDKVKSFPFHEHSLLSLFIRPPAEPLFDATGLRGWVHAQMSKTLVGEEWGAYLSRRAQLALAIDDETSYSYFNAYVAYRFGLRARVVDSEAEMVRLLGKGSTACTDLALTFEDVYLNFPDRNKKRFGEDGIHWSDLEKRTELLPGLKGASVVRVFVTTGHEKVDERERLAENARFRRSLALSGRLGKKVEKPFAGLFDLWAQAGLDPVRRKRRWGLPEEGSGPSPDASGRGKPLKRGGHSAPGRLLAVATWLIARAERALASGVSSVPEAVHGAVLATEALELLGGRTPTTALEALALRHEFEVRAECQFAGIGAHFDVEPRMREISGEIGKLSAYFAEENRRSSCWSAEARILGRLVRVFRDNLQFDEELRLQIRNRTLHRLMWFKERKFWGPFGDRLRWFNPAYWAVRYVHFLVDSIPRFLLCIAAWIAVVAILRTIYINGVLGPWQEHPMLGHLTEAVAAFLGANLPGWTGGDPPGNVLYFILAVAATAGGVLHFGIFVSHLYALVSRR